MRVVHSSHIVFVLLIAVISGVATAAICIKTTAIGIWPAFVVPVFVLVFGFRRAIRRWHVASQSLSQQATEWLNRNVSFYRELDIDGKAVFERNVRFILKEWIFESIKEIRVTSEMQWSVAAGAAVLLHGRPEWELPYRHTVLFYPGSFDQDYLHSEEASFEGMAHSHGPIILSAGAVESTWSVAGTGRNVILHELAHLLDYEDSFADGIPALVEPKSQEAWKKLIQNEISRIVRGRSILRDYGATNPAEFFAVAVETFFERPHQMKKGHPELYQAIETLLNLNPAG